MQRLTGVMVICAVLGGVQAAAENGPQPYPDFTFKRVGVPEPGTRRLTIQIDPKEQARLLQAVMPPPVAAAASPEAAATPDPYGWFWSEVSPALGDGAGRFQQAMVVLGRAPGADQSGLRLQQLQDIAAVHGKAILTATVGTRVSPALVLAVIAVESGGRADAVSRSGAVGLMQLIPATADRFKVADSTQAAQNIRGGVAYLDWLMREFGGDPVLVLAAYNSGENAVKGAGGVPGYPETRAYVPKVLAAWALARGLCLTQPELVSDGCVFAVRG
ncbi:MAG: lytic transglycosylase domain-containing protein [Phaeovulum sp.]|uniref:lytic transglycosylase domain-containing protein n=1 Tax=Phaeovulum sp. TaxID=2934796 RepID=UPI002730FA1C|nr:lytic transglycosylase domain-containing protein [Phaeovulum sp.]MDP2061643.1 lytic transglycosylase domain-containing protein [Phaeovulum sp.]